MTFNLHPCIQSHTSIEQYYRLSDPLQNQLLWFAVADRTFLDRKVLESIQRTPKEFKWNMLRKTGLQGTGIAIIDWNIMLAKILKRPNPQLLLSELETIYLSLLPLFLGDKEYMYVPNGVLDQPSRTSAQPILWKIQRYPTILSSWQWLAVYIFPFVPYVFPEKASYPHSFLMV